MKGKEPNLKEIESSHMVGSEPFGKWFQLEFYCYYESINRDLKKRLVFECCDGRLKVKGEGSTRLGYTRWREEP